MPLIPIDNVGAAGLIRDIWAPDTPPEAWSDMRNARMGPFGAEKFLGQRAAVAAFTVQPYWLAYYQKPGLTGYWVCLGEEKIYIREAIASYAETNATRQSAGVDVNYAATATKKWSADNFGGLLIANNGVDVPQFWTGDAADNFADLTNWPAGYVAGNLRPFGRYLVALNLKVSGTPKPQLVKWSHPADYANVPSSWDYTDPSVDAGEYPLMDARGALVDQCTLREVNVLYTTEQAWAMRWIGGNDIFGFKPAVLTQGALAQHCVARFKKTGEFQLVLGSDDIYIFNGQTAESILEPKLRRWFFSQIDPTYYQRSFVVANPRFSEVWCCVPQVGYEQPNIALVWNWLTNTICFRDLLEDTDDLLTRSSAATKGTPSIVQGFMEDLTGETWATISGTYSTITLAWQAALEASPVTPILLMAGWGVNQPYLVDSSADFAGAAIPWNLERTGIAFSGVDRQGQPKSDGAMVKLLTEIWPRFDAAVGTEVAISIGVQMTQDEAPTWYDEGVYVVGEDEFKAVYQVGRYFSIRYSNSSDGALRLLGYSLMIDGMGQY